MRLPFASPTADVAQAATPLLDALVTAAGSVRAPFFFPGHKMGGGAPRRLRQKLLHGDGRMLRYDLPELPELDNLFAAEGPIADAQELAAAAFGAGRTWFLINGSTAGIIAAVLACVQLKRQSEPGGPPPLVILPRNAHQSAVHALVSSGAVPVWVAPDYDAQSGLCLGLRASEVKRALRAHGGARRVAAVLVVSPTYHGICSDVGALAAACSGADGGGVPLIVDEAHGAHLDFLPPPPSSPPSASPSVSASPLSLLSSKLSKLSWLLWLAPPPPRTLGYGGGGGGGVTRAPRGALLGGAPLVVQSTHKTCGALTQSAMLHGSAEGLARWPALPTALDAALAQLQSSSPSYLLLASLDAARWQLAAPDGGGRAALSRAVEIADELRARLPAVVEPHGLELLALREGGGGLGHEGEEGGEGGEGGACYAVDPLRVTLLTHRTRSTRTSDGGAAAGGAARAGVETAAPAAPSSSGWDGLALDEALIEHGVYCELPEASALTFAVSAGTTRAHARRLERALGAVLRDGPPPASGDDADADADSADAASDAASDAAASDASSGAAESVDDLRLASCNIEARYSPREAFYLPRRAVAAEDAIGRASAELVCPYPPGIPLLVPGEVVTAEALRRLRRLRAAGCVISGCDDPSLETLGVLEEP